MRFYHHINIYIKSKIHKKKKKKKKKFIIGKTSKKSRKTSYLRKKKRKLRLTRSLKSKEEEISDLQIQIIDFEKLAADSGESILYEVNKCSRENNNLVEWLKLYDEQIKNYQREIYNLNLKLYFNNRKINRNINRKIIRNIIRNINRKIICNIICNIIRNIIRKINNCSLSNYQHLKAWLIISIISKISNDFYFHSLRVTLRNI